MRLRNPRSFTPTINLTPLIDILFIVLIFLVLTTTFKEATTLQISLPRAETGEREARDLPGVVTVSVAADGSVELRGEAVPLDRLSERLAVMIQQNMSTLRLRADADASHGVVVQIMDIARRSGIAELSIETRLATAEAP